MKDKLTYWNGLPLNTKRHVLLWLYILRKNPSDARSCYVEPKLVDRDRSILVHKIPKHIFMMNNNQLIREIDKNGGPPKWINGAI
jgi:hypothetical protein